MARFNQTFVIEFFTTNVTDVWLPEGLVGVGLVEEVYRQGNVGHGLEHSVPNHHGPWGVCVCVCVHAG